MSRVYYAQWLTLSKGSVRQTPEGEIRWTVFSIFHGEERWRSEGIQVGGIRSARGVLGNWFDKLASSKVVPRTLTVLMISTETTTCTARQVPRRCGRRQTSWRKREQAVRPTLITDCTPCLIRRRDDLAAVGATQPVSGAVALLTMSSSFG